MLYSLFSSHDKLRWAICPSFPITLLSRFGRSRPQRILDRSALTSPAPRPSGNCSLFSGATAALLLSNTMHDRTSPRVLWIGTRPPYWLPVERKIDKIARKIGVMQLMHFLSFKPHTCVYTVNLTFFSPYNNVKLLKLNMATRGQSMPN